MRATNVLRIGVVAGLGLALAGPVAGQARVKLPRPNERTLPINRTDTLLPPRPPTILPVPTPVPPRSPRPVQPPIWYPRDHCYYPYVVTTGSGLTVRGRYSGDNWSVGFRLGTPGGIWHHPVRYCTGYGYSPIVWPSYPYGYGLGYTGRYAMDNVRYVVADPSIAGVPAAPAPAPPPAPPPTDRELGDRALARGDADAAVNHFRAHLRSNPGDARTTRMLGLALIEAGEMRDGAAVVGTAYLNDPELAGVPIRSDAISRGERGVRSLVNRVSIYANKSDAQGAWVTLAALIQAEGRDAAALRAVERAEKAGTDAEVIARLRANLRP